MKEREELLKKIEENTAKAEEVSKALKQLEDEEANHKKAEVSIIL